MTTEADWRRPHPLTVVVLVVTFITGNGVPLLLVFAFGGGGLGFDTAAVVAGGVTVGDVLAPVSTEDLPFGGIGPSGMGHYHGREGFEAFSNMRGIVAKGRFNSTSLVGAPWDRLIFRSLVVLQWLKFRKRAL